MRVVQEIVVLVVTIDIVVGVITAVYGVVTAFSNPLDGCLLVLAGIVMVANAGAMVVITRE